MFSSGRWSCSILLDVRRDFALRFDDAAETDVGLLLGRNINDED